MFLYIDTTFGTTVGLLKPDFTWLEYCENDGQKTASTLHTTVEKLCRKNQVEINQLQGLIQVAGPGGYTGLRVSDGISQTFSWLGFTTYSFYHYEILNLLSKTMGYWVSNAFKGEIFVFDQSTQSHWLEKENDWFCKAQTHQFYTHYFSAFSPTAKSRLQSGQFIETSQLIKIHSQSLFSQIVQSNSKREIFYYRPIEQEFTKANSPKN